MAKTLIDYDFIASSMVNNILEPFGLCFSNVEDVIIIDKDKFKEIVSNELKTTKQRGGKPKPQSAKFEFNSDHARPFKIKGVRRNGTIYSTKQDYSWDMNHVLYIKKHYDEIESWKDLNTLCKTINLNNWVVGRIMWNLKEGYLDNVIDVYHNLQYQTKQVPIQNNPQKRKEMGYI